MSLISYITEENAIVQGADKVKLLFTFLDHAGAVLDISTVTQKKCRLQYPNKTTIDIDPLVLETNGLNGQAYVLLTSTHTANVGWHEAAGWVAFAGSFQGWSLPVRFRVVPKLPEP